MANNSEARAQLQMQLQDRTFDGLFKTSTSPRTDWIKLPRSINRALAGPYQPRSAWPEFRFSSLYFSYTYIYVYLYFFHSLPSGHKNLLHFRCLYKKICSNSLCRWMKTGATTKNNNNKSLGSIFRVTHFSCLYFQLFKVIINLGAATRCTQLSVGYAIVYYIYIVHTRSLLVIKISHICIYILCDYTRR